MALGKSAICRQELFSISCDWFDPERRFRRALPRPTWKKMFGIHYAARSEECDGPPQWMQKVWLRSAFSRNNPRASAVTSEFWLSRAPPRQQPTPATAEEQHGTGLSVRPAYGSLAEAFGLGRGPEPFRRRLNQREGLA